MLAFHRRARRGLARRGAGHSADHRKRRAVSAPRPDPVRHLRRHHHHAGRPGPDAADRHPLARRRRARQEPSIGASRRPSLPRATRRSSASRQHLEKIAERAQSQRGDRRVPQRASRPPRAAHSRAISTTGSQPCATSNDLRLELIAAERDFLYELLRDGKITDESRRRLERELDLEEAAILARREGDDAAVGSFIRSLIRSSRQRSRLTRLSS